VAMGQGGGDEGRRAIGSNNQVTCKEKMAVEEKGSSTLNNNIKIKNKRCIISKKRF